MKKLNHMALLVLMSVTVTGCTHLLPLEDTTTVSGATTDETEVPESRSNLLLSLRHHASYGLIPYGSKKVLYRDLTKPHPSAQTVAVSQEESLAVAGASQVRRYIQEARSFPGRTVKAGKTEAAIGREPTENLSEAENSTVTGRQSVSDTLPDHGSINSIVNSMPTTREDSREEAVTSLNMLGGADGSHGCLGRHGYVRNADETWLAERDPERWTIQIVSTADASEPCIDRAFLQELEAPEARRFSVYHQNGVWNIAVTGDYANADEALEAAERFDLPWVRRIGELRNRRCNSVVFMPDQLKATLSPWCVTDSDSRQTVFATVDASNRSHVTNRLSPFQQ